MQKTNGLHEWPNLSCIHRSNNSQLVFPDRDYYLYFLSKINEFIRPHAEILAWCLMPTHFHLMIEVVNERIEIIRDADPMTWAHRISSNEEELSHPMNSSHRMSPQPSTKMRTLNDSIAIMLRSYTRAINKQFKKHGSLFQQHTKAICLTEPEFAPAYFDTHFGMMGNLDLPETNYMKVCLDYIHLNPVNDRLVRNPEDWEFSSYRDYYCGRKGKLVNRELAKELSLIG